MVAVFGWPVRELCRQRSEQIVLGEVGHLGELRVADDIDGTTLPNAPANANVFGEELVATARQPCRFSLKAVLDQVELWSRGRFQQVDGHDHRLVDPLAG